MGEIFPCQGVQTWSSDTHGSNLLATHSRERLFIYITFGFSTRGSRCGQICSLIHMAPACVPQTWSSCRCLYPVEARLLASYSGLGWLFLFLWGGVWSLGISQDFPVSSARHFGNVGDSPPSQYFHLTRYCCWGLRIWACYWDPKVSQCDFYCLLY